MPPNLDSSIAVYSPRNEDKAEDYYRVFLAPALDPLGKQINVAVLANDVEGHSGAEASQFAVRTIEAFFRSHPTADARQAISAALMEANVEIRQVKSLSPNPKAAGVSAIVAVFSSDRVFVGGLGSCRAYLIREGEVKPLAPDLSWVREAHRTGQASPGELEGGSLPSSYLGKNPTVSPDFAPIEFLWPGETIVLLTAGVAGRLSENQIKEYVKSRAPTRAAEKLVSVARQTDSSSGMAALVIRVPEDYPVLAPAPKPKATISPAVKGLLVGNAILVLLIAAFFLRSSSFGSLLRPAPTIEIAKPVFLTPTPQPDLPGPDVGQLAPTPDIPAAAPSLAPVAGPTVIPTFTPFPTPNGWQQPGAPRPTLPDNGSTFNGPDAEVVLGWDSVGTLPDDVFYVVTIRKFVDSKLVGESLNWTKATRIRLDSSFYAVLNDRSRIVGLAAPRLEGTVSQFEWYVTLYRLTKIKSDGTLEGDAISPSSNKLSFFWGPALQQAPTRVYGGDALATDPFFQAQRARQASSNAVISPVSFGLAGLWIGFVGFVAGVSRLGKYLRKRARSRSR